MVTWQERVKTLMTEVSFVYDVVKRGIISRSVRRNHAVLHTKNLAEKI